MTATIWRQQVLVLLTAGLMFLTHLGGPPLFDEDEPKNAVCGREMYLRGDWIVPTFNATLRTDKPVLIYWWMQGSYRLFGVNEFAARFGSAVASIGTVLLVFHLGRMLFSARTGVLSAIALASCINYVFVGRAVTPDANLIGFVTLGLTVFVGELAGWREGGFSQPCHPRAEVSVAAATQTSAGAPVPIAWQRWAEVRWGAAVAMGAAFGVAILAKGPVAIVLPSAILVTFVLLMRAAIEATAHAAMPSRPAETGWWTVMNQWLADTARWGLRTFSPARILAAVWTLRLPVLIAAATAVALPWYVAVGWATEGAWLQGFLGGHNLGRFAKPMEGHSGPIVFYVPVILAGTFPWSAFAGLIAWRVVSRWRRHSAGETAAGAGADSLPVPAVVLACSWIGVWVSVFSMAGTKLPNYVLPVYPAIALLIGDWLDTWLSDDSRGLRWWRVVGCQVLAGIGGLIVVGLGAAALQLFPAHWMVAAIGAVPLVGGLVSWWLLQTRGSPAAASSLIVSALAFVLALVTGVAGQVAPLQDGVRVARLVQELQQDRGSEVATFEFFAPNLVFYLGQPVPQLQTSVEAIDFLKEPGRIVITRRTSAAQLLEQLNGAATILGETPRFLKSGDVVLVGGPSVTTAPSDRATRMAPARNKLSAADTLQDPAR